MTEGNSKPNVYIVEQGDFYVHVVFASTDLQAAKKYAQEMKGVGVLSCWRGGEEVWRHSFTVKQLELWRERKAWQF